MINVKTHVAITIELNRPNFTLWSTLFKAMVRKFGLLPYLDSTVPVRPSNPVWAQTVYDTKGWVDTSVDNSILALAITTIRPPVPSTP
jgi:hypothetical protein